MFLDDLKVSMLKMWVEAGLVDAILPIMIDPTVERYRYMELFGQILKYVSDETYQSIHANGSLCRVFHYDCILVPITSCKPLFKRAPPDVLQTWISTIYSQCNRYPMMIFSITNDLAKEISTPALFQALNTTNFFTLFLPELRAHEDPSVIFSEICYLLLKIFTKRKRNSPPYSEEPFKVLAFLIEIWIQSPVDSNTHRIDFNLLIVCITTLLGTCNKQNIHFITNLKLMELLSSTRDYHKSIVRGLFDIGKILVQLDQKIILRKYIDEGFLSFIEEAVLHCQQQDPSDRYDSREFSRSLESLRKIQLMNEIQIYDEVMNRGRKGNKSSSKK